MEQNNNDKTKKILSEILNDLYKQQGVASSHNQDSYLEGQDGQYLGKITTNKYDNDSITNKYGPYGSKYSSTSVFNKYSLYGSRYGQYSLNNPYSSTPPKLIIRGKLKAYVSNNPHIRNRVSPEVFFYNLENNLNNFISGKIIESENDLRKLNGESFIEAHDGTYLGSLVPNQLNQKSIFNQFSPYGSQFSQTSIFNQFSPYGGQFSQLSPYNQFSQTPPKIYQNGKFIAHLTKNKFLTPRVDPNDLFEWARSSINQFTVD